MTIPVKERGNHITLLQFLQRCGRIRDLLGALAKSDQYDSCGNFKDHKNNVSHGEVTTNTSSHNVLRSAKVKMNDCYIKLTCNIF